jgi:hypothetical protein
MGSGSGGGGCTREIPRSITPSSTSMTTPQPWDLPVSSHLSSDGSVRLAVADESNPKWVDIKCMIQKSKDKGKSRGVDGINPYVQYSIAVR